jgi:hypothetical protein
VYTPGNVIAPEVVSWQCLPPTRLAGSVFDSAGQPVIEGSTVEVKVTKDNGGVIYDRTVPVVHGQYSLDDVPEPGRATIIIARVPGWPARTRRDGLGSKSQDTPLIFNFGGPSVPADPDGPAYFLARDLDAPDMATTSVSGRVYDLNGQLVPDSAGAKVIVNALRQDTGTPGFQAQVDVHAGLYTIEGVPTGSPASIELRINPVYPLSETGRSVVLIPPRILGHANVLNFGGPATPEDPTAPRYPFPSPSYGLAAPSPFAPG